MTSLENRMHFLERKVRRYQLATLLLGFVVVGSLTVAMAPGPVPDALKAKSFQVVDDRGKVIVSLFSGQEGGNLVLLDANGRIVVAAGAGSKGGGFAVVNQHGQTVLSAEAVEWGGEITLDRNPEVIPIGDWTDPAGWKALTGGMSPDDVRALLGNPKSILPRGESRSWSYGDSEGTVFFDSTTLRVSGWEAPGS